MPASHTLVLSLSKDTGVGGRSSLTIYGKVSGMDVDLEQADRRVLLTVIASQREQLAMQREQLGALETQVTTLTAQVTTLAARVAELEHRDPPPWAKANRPKAAESRPPRKKREHTFSRRVEAPTETVTHAVETGPDCGAGLRGGTAQPASGGSAGQVRIWRRQHRRAFEQALRHVCAPFAGKGAGVPQRVLCQRVQKYLPELFTFLADPRVPADNPPEADRRTLRPPHRHPPQDLRRHPLGGRDADAHGAVDTDRYLAAPTSSSPGGLDRPAP
jgi:hypothetical protein